MHLVQSTEKKSIMRTITSGLSINTVQCSAEMKSKSTFMTGGVDSFKTSFERFKFYKVVLLSELYRFIIDVLCF